MRYKYFGAIFTGQSILVWVIGISIILRIGFALYLGDQVIDLPGTADQISYHNLALRVLGGNGFSFDKPWWPITPRGCANRALELFIHVISGRSVLLVWSVSVGCQNYPGDYNRYITSISCLSNWRSPFLKESWPHFSSVDCNIRLFHLLRCHPYDRTFLYHPGYGKLVSFYTDWPGIC